MYLMHASKATDTVSTSSFNSLSQNIFFRTRDKSKDGSHVTTLSQIFSLDMAYLCWSSDLSYGWSIYPLAYPPRNKAFIKGVLIIGFCVSPNKAGVLEPLFPRGVRGRRLTSSWLPAVENQSIQPFRFLMTFPFFGGCNGVHPWKLT